MSRKIRVPACLHLDHCPDRAVIGIFGSVGENSMKVQFIVSDLGEMGSSMKVVANRSKTQLGQYITLQDVESCLESQPNKENINE